MSRFSGRYYQGASRDIRDEKHREATKRNDRTPLQRRRAYRLAHPSAATVRALDTTTEGTP
jgi:hypothetical protein